MAISESRLRSLLEECGVTLLPATDSVIPFVLSHGGERLCAVAVTSNEGRIVQFRTVGMIETQGTRHRRELLAALLHACYEYKLVKFAFDHDNGEVLAYIDLFLDEAQLTKQQCQRCINALRNVVLGNKDRFQKIIDTGQDPGKPPARQRRLEALSELLSSLSDSPGSTENRPKPPSPPTQKPPKRGGNSSDGFDEWLGGLLDD